MPEWVGELLDKTLEASVVLSFSRLGLVLRRRFWEPAELDVDLSGRVALVTGANSGLGYATAEGLATLNATVWLLVRNLSSGREARQTIIERTGNEKVHLLRIDLSDLNSVRTAARQLTQKTQQIHILIHNAGILPDQRQLSVDGIELAAATHVVGPMALTLELLPILQASAPSRILWVSSGGMYTQKLHVDDFQSEQEPYQGAVTYARLKRAQVVLSELLAERLAEQQVTSNAMHPGWVDTPGLRDSLPRFYRLMQPFLRSPAEGADTLLWLAAAPHLEQTTGLFWHDRRPRATHRLKRTRASTAERQALWDLCLQLSRQTGAMETVMSPGNEPA